MLRLVPVAWSFLGYTGVFVVDSYRHRSGLHMRKILSIRTAITHSKQILKNSQRNIAVKPVSESLGPASLLDSFRPLCLVLVRMTKCHHQASRGRTSNRVFPRLFMHNPTIHLAPSLFILKLTCFRCAGTHT